MGVALRPRREIANLAMTSNYVTYFLRLLISNLRIGCAVGRGVLRARVAPLRIHRVVPNCVSIHWDEHHDDRRHVNSKSSDNKYLRNVFSTIVY